jgi:glyoxylase-like metal-dependent hydrolase (beta-lactamase superfamily II)
MSLRNALGLCLRVVLLAAAYATAAPAAAPKLQVEVYKGGFASVNSFIFSNGHSLLVMDVQRKASEASKLVDLIKAKHLPLTTILISHGHTDHFTGMALLHAEFPQARIVVASEAIKRDIKAYAIYMDQGGATGAEPALDPALRPRSVQNPGGFDYEHTIEVLGTNTVTLEGGGTLELTSDYPPTEAAHMTTVYSKDLNALFLADLGYNRVHPWMGDDIDSERVSKWRSELLRIKAKYAALNPRVYPGHGDPTDRGLFDRMVRYIDDFTRITAAAPSTEEAMRNMQVLYPDYEQADFFLKYSVENHVRAASVDSAVRAERQWLMMVRTVNTDATREKQFNEWYDRIDIPDVLEVPGYWRARRGQTLPESTSNGAAGAASSGEVGHYVALYNIGSPAIDKTIIDMLMASWNMDRVGRGTDLIKVVERVYFGQYSAPVSPPGRSANGRSHFLFVERFGVADSRDYKQFNAWYDAHYQRAAASVPGVIHATRYELYRVLMFEPQSAPRFLTLYEIDADSVEEARHAAAELTQVDERDRSRAGYVGAAPTLYAELRDVEGR